jgi:hypothetical protein
MVDRRGNAGRGGMGRVKMTMKTILRKGEDEDLQTHKATMKTISKKGPPKDTAATRSAARTAAAKERSEKIKDDAKRRT